MFDRFFFALQILSRIPTPNITFDEVALGRSTAYFPLVGIILGVILAGVTTLAAFVFHHQVTAVLVLLTEVGLTGGIHLDGYMDTVDGVMSGRPREQKLTIMRDSRVGSYAVVWVICLLLTKYAFIGALLDKNIRLFLMVIPFILALSRWGMAYAVIKFPYARPEGLGKLYARYSSYPQLIIASVPVLIYGLILRQQLLYLILIPVAFAATFLNGKLLCRILGGLTGDTYGFINEVNEVLLLFCSCLLAINR